MLAYSLCTGSLETGTEVSIGLLASVAGWLGLVRPHYRQLSRRIDAGRVACAEGHVTRERDGWPDYQGNSGSCSHYYVLGTRMFLVSGDGYTALVEGRAYRICYLTDAPTDRRQVMSPMVNIALVAGPGRPHPSGAPCRKYAIPHLLRIAVGSADALSP